MIGLLGSVRVNGVEPSGEVFGADGGGCVCAVRENGNAYASALIVVSHARALTNDAFLKMLDSDLSVSTSLSLLTLERK